MRRYKLKFKNGQVTGDEIALEKISTYFIMNDKGIAIEQVSCFCGLYNEKLHGANMIKGGM